MIELTINGKIQPKERPRKGMYGAFYTPQKTRDYAEYIKTVYLQKYRRAIKMQGALSSVMIVFLPIPKSASKKKQEDMIAGKIRPTTKPDIDNIEKSVWDALNGLAYEDDKQIVESYTLKYYAREEKIRITIKELEKIE